jgi:starvation-inducible DNA-binding protein
MGAGGGRPVLQAENAPMGERFPPSREKISFRRCAEAKVLRSSFLCNAVRDLADALNTLLADMLGLYLKTKNFHWQISGPHFRDYHPPLDEHGDELFATTDAIAERVRKIGGTTLRSIGHISRLQRIQDLASDRSGWSAALCARLWLLECSFASSRKKALSA